MARLPQVGGDEGNWGSILNSYLLVSHDLDGKLRAAADIADAKTKADSAVQQVNGKSGTSLSLTATDVGAYTKPADGIPLDDLEQTVQDAIGAVSTDGLILPNGQTADYTLVATDAGKAVEMNTASTTILTIPAHSQVDFPIGTTIEAVQMGDGQVVIQAAPGVVINSPGGVTKTRARYSVVVLRKNGPDSWLLSGDVATTLHPIAAYDMEVITTDTIADKSGNDNILTVGSANSLVTGHTGKALRTPAFGTSAADLGGMAPTSMEYASATIGAGTIMAWVNMFNLPADTEVFLFGYMDGVGTNSLFCIYAQRVWGTPGVLQADIRTDQGLQEVDDGSTVLPLNTWTHLAFVWDGSKALLYRDGSVVTELSLTGHHVVSQGTPQFFVGNYGGAYSYADYDDVRVFRDALSSSEISWYMNQPV